MYFLHYLYKTLLYIINHALRCMYMYVHISFFLCPWPKVVGLLVFPLCLSFCQKFCSLFMCVIDLILGLEQNLLHGASPVKVCHISSSISYLLDPEAFCHTDPLFSMIFLNFFSVCFRPVSCYHGYLWYYLYQNVILVFCLFM